MALIKCRECSKEISDQAKSCPNCGCPIKEDKQKNNKNRNIGINIWLILCIIICLTISLVDIFNLLDIEKITLNVNNIDFCIMSYLAYVLGITYLLLLKNKNKISLYMMLGLNILVILFNIFELEFTLTFKMGLSIMYILCAILNTFITTLVIRKHLNNNRLSLKNNKLILIIFVIGIITLLIINLQNGMNYPQTNARDENVSQVEVITSYINIRSQMNMDSDIIGKVYYGEIYTILNKQEESENHWIEIETSNGIRGYIYGIDSYVKRLDIPVVEDQDPIDAPIDNSQNNNPNINSNNETINNNNSGVNNKENINKANNNNNNSQNDTPNNIPNNNVNPPKQNEANNEENAEKEMIQKKYLEAVNLENLRYEKEVQSVKEEYDLHEKQAKDKMTDEKYFVSFFGGLYYGTESDYKREYQNFMRKGDYDSADILAGRWQHTEEYRKWEEYLRGLPQEEQYYLNQKQENHEKILMSLKQEYNQ